MKTLLILILILVSCPTFAWHLAVGANKSLLDVQDKKGDEVKNPFSQVISVGTIPITLEFSDSHDLKVVS
jgi:hypothetical protein